MRSLWTRSRRGPRWLRARLASCPRGQRTGVETGQLRGALGGSARYARRFDLRCSASGPVRSADWRESRSVEVTRKQQRSVCGQRPSRPCRRWPTQACGLSLAAPKFSPEKLSVTFLGGEASGFRRRYTLTHNDITGRLFLSVGSDYNTEQVSGWCALP